MQRVQKVSEPLGMCKASPLAEWICSCSKVVRCEQANGGGSPNQPTQSSRTEFPLGIGSQRETQTSFK